MSARSAAMPAHADAEQARQLRRAVVASAIGTTIFGHYGGFAVAIYIVVCAVITLGAVALMPERSRRDISLEYEGEATHRGAPASVPS